MHFKHLTASWFFVGLVLTAQLWAGELKFLGTTSAVDPIALLPAPPVAGSPEDQADLESAYRVYSARTAAETALGREENKLTIFHFASAIGPSFQPGMYPKIEALFVEVESETKALTNEAKDHWKRIRPYHVAPLRFVDPIEREAKTSYSYPSGHSTRGTVYSLLLAELFPEHREALIAKGRETGWLRVRGGVHHPLDIYGGRVLGQAIVRALLANPDFKKALLEAKAELVANQPSTTRMAVSR